MASSILNSFLQGTGLGACSGSVASWPGIAVPPGFGSLPTNLPSFYLQHLYLVKYRIMIICTFYWFYHTLLVLSLE